MDSDEDEVFFGAFTTKEQAQKWSSLNDTIYPLSRNLADDDDDGLLSQQPTSDDSLHNLTLSYNEPNNLQADPASKCLKVGSVLIEAELSTYQSCTEDPHEETEQSTQNASICLNAIEQTYAEEPQDCIQCSQDVNKDLGASHQACTEKLMEDADQIGPAVNTFLGMTLPEVVFHEPEDNNIESAESKLADSSTDSDLMADNLPYYVLESLRREQDLPHVRGEKDKQSCDMRKDKTDRLLEDELIGKEVTEVEVDGEEIIISGEKPAVIRNLSANSEFDSLSLHHILNKLPQPLNKFKTPLKPKNKMDVKRGRFDHVISPVARYIRENPAPPLFQNVEARTDIKSLRNWPTPAICGSMWTAHDLTGSNNLLLNDVKLCRELYPNSSVQVDENSDSSNIPPLPHCSYKSTGRGILDEENPQKSSGGRITGIVGPPSALIVKHKGHVKVPKKSLQMISNNSNSEEDGSMMEVSLYQIRSPRKPFK